MNALDAGSIPAGTTKNPDGGTIGKMTFYRNTQTHVISTAAGGIEISVQVSLNISLLHGIGSQKEPKRMKTLGYYTSHREPLGSSAPRIKVDKVLKSVLAAERRKRERRKTMDGLAFLFYLPRIRGFHAGYVSSDKRRQSLNRNEVTTKPSVILVPEAHRETENGQNFEQRRNHDRRRNYCRAET